MRSRLSFGFVIAVVVLLAECCHAQSYRLKIYAGDKIGRATAVCVGATDDGHSLFVTARHNFDDADSAVVYGKGWEITVRDVWKHKSEDVAAFITDRREFAWIDIDEPVTGETVAISGFGPEYQNQQESTLFRGVMRDDAVHGIDGAHPIPGDSGGAVWVETKSGKRFLVGLVSGFSPARHVTSRRDRAAERLETVIVKSRFVRQCLQYRYQYSCPPGGCPIYIRPQVQQPMIGIGVPVGPPRVVGVAEPAPILARPSPQPDLSPLVRREVQDWLEANREQLRGDPGPAGEDGKPGNPGRSIDREQAADIISTWLEANMDQLKGDPGAPGKDGRDGKPGERGLIGVPSEKEIAAVIDLWISRNDAKIRQYIRQVIQEQGEAPESGELEERLTRLEKQKLRMMVVDGETKNVLDDESYAPGEPVILDIRRLKGSPDAK